MSAPTKDRIAEQNEPIARSVAPYDDGGALLVDELRRIDLLVRAATHVWRASIAADKPERLWGMLHVSDAEVDRYLTSPFDLAPPLPDAIAAECAVLIEQARALGVDIGARVAATTDATALPLCWLSSALELEPLERDVLLIALLPSIDARYRRLFAYLQDDATRTAPSVELVLQILAPRLPSLGVGHALFAPSATLRRQRLLDVPDQGDRPFTTRAVQLDEAIVRHLLGGRGLSSELVPFVEEVAERPELEALEVEATTLERLQTALDAWREASKRERALPAVVLRGAEGAGRMRAARALGAATGLPLLCVDLRDAPTEPTQFRHIVELATREAVLRRAAVIWIDVATDAQGSLDDALRSAIERHPGPTILVSERGPERRSVARSLLDVDLPQPGHELRRRTWRQRLTAPDFAEIAGPDSVCELLANAFRLRVQDIDEVVDGARAAARLRGANSAVSAADLFDGCRRRSGIRLGGMAQRIEPTTDLGFDDLVLPTANRRQLEDLRRRIHNRHRVLHELGFERRIAMGRGLCALFSGGSGTGKTFAATLLAQEQGVDLYRIDLSAVVSKYVGETEKNLERVFVEAEDANAILFFDEADALFGKRGDIKEARDRWANLEVDFLLQRVEQFEGVVILATNLRQNIDEAFLRRLHSIVEFPAPDGDARARIWLGLFPPGLARPADAEIERLAALFALPGGSIKNVVVDAAYRAVADAEDATPEVELRHLVGALGRELQKLGRPVTRSEFGDELYPWAKEEVLG